MTAVTIRPNGAGTYTAIDAQYPASGAHYDKENDQSNSTFVYVNALPQSQKNDTYAMKNISLPAGSTIDSIVVWRTVQGESTITTERGYSRNLIYDGSLLSQGTNTRVPSTWANASTTYTTNPATGLAWTEAEVNALEAGVGLTVGTDGVNPINTDGSEVWIVVNYTVPVVVQTYGDGLTWIVAMLQSKPKVVIKT